MSAGLILKLHHSLHPIWIYLFECLNFLLLFICGIYYFFKYFIMLRINVAFKISVWLEQMRKLYVGVVVRLFEAHSSGKV